MSDFQFINVFSGSSPQGSSSETSFWNVYLNEKENIYIIQKLDENNKPTSEKYKVSPTFFGVNFRKINNIKSESKTKKDLIFVRSKDKGDGLFGNASAKEQKEKAEKKKTGEFLIQLSENTPEPVRKKSENAPAANLASKKTNEFQLNVSAAPQKQKNVNEFGLSSLLSNFTKTNKKEKPSSFKLLTKDLSSAAVSDILSAPTAEERSNSQQIKNTPNAEKPAEAQQSEQIEELDRIQKAYGLENSFPETQSAAAAEINTSKDEITNTEEALLEPKGVKENLNFSEKALKLDMSLRQEFQATLYHWNSARKNLARRRFSEILNRPAQYVPAHKHMFTDFAIKLRKINLHELALQYATKSTTLSPDDSHAFFNVARLYYELGRYEEANGFIDKSLKLENGLEPARRLSSIIKECIRRKAQNK